MRKSVTISVNEELLKVVDEYCNEMSINRSQAFTMAFVQMQQQRLAVRSLNKLTDILQEAIKRGAITDDDKEEVERLEKALFYCAP